MTSRITSVGCLLFLLALAAAPASGQAGRAELNGTVFDQGRAVLPGVAVTVVNEATSIERTTFTGVEGRFVMSTLTPGTYTVRVELSGFQTQTQPGVLLAVGQELTLTFTLEIGGVAEEVTVTGRAPVVEVTTNRVGTNVTNAEIDNLPSAGRNQLSLMQVVPGLTPSFSPGEFEGGQYNANGRETGSNVFMLDGLHNYSTRNGGSRGGQARVALDAMDEFQVLTHQYAAEYGGSSGVVVNAVSKSGSNEFSGRGSYYYQDESLDATDHFVKQEGGKTPESGSAIYGFNVGGPIARNKAFFFFNLERSSIDRAVTLVFPAEAAPLAVSFSDAIEIRALNTFIRGDYQASANHNLSFRWVREAATEWGDSWEQNRSTKDNIEYEQDQGDQLYSFNWTWVVGNNAVNEFKVGHVRQTNLSGNRQYFDDDLNFIGLNGRDQFDIGSANDHPDFSAGPLASHGLAKERHHIVENTFTLTKSGWGGDHTFKLGFNWNRPAVLPAIVGSNDNGSFEFSHNLPFDPANAYTYPSNFSILLGEIFIPYKDWGVNWFVQDKWQASDRVTLNLGLRYDYQDMVSRTKNAYSPRIGLAWDPTGGGNTVIRAGLGKFYEGQLIRVGVDLLQRGVFPPTFEFETGEDLSADSGQIPAHVCLQPTGNNGLAVISPACRDEMVELRNRVTGNTGEFINREPRLDGDRRLGYLWGYSFGVKREVLPNLALSVDYVGNQARDQTAYIDINEPRILPNGSYGRPGVDVFDPSGELVPAAARGRNFRRVLQFQTLAALNADYNALEIALEKRYSDRWSARFAYTLSESNNSYAGGGTSQVRGRVTDDLNPRVDYGRANFDNRHAVVGSFNVNPWGGFGAGAVIRYYSGYPINETTGSDNNGDNDRNDRPLTGRDDENMPIRSPLDGDGRAIRNGLDGENFFAIDLRLQYIVSLPRAQTLGLFLELYNATNRVNFGDGTGNRRSSNFLIPTTAGDPRTTQLGIRFTF